MTNPNPLPLRELLQTAGRRLGLEGALETGLLWSRWTELVGDAVAAHAEPTSLKAGILRIRTDSPTWATEISYLTDEIKARANRMTGRAIVSEVRVWTSPDPVRRPRDQIASPRATHPSGAREPDPSEGVDDALARAKEAWRKRRSEAPSERLEKP